MDGAGRPEVVDHRSLVLAAGDERLPGGEMLEAMEVARRNHRQARPSDPAEQLVSVEELEAVDGRGELVPALGEAGGPAQRFVGLAQRIGMSGDQRGAGSSRLGKGDAESVLEADESAKADRDRVSSLPRVDGVVGELEAGNHEQPVEGASPSCLAVDRIEVVVVVSRVNMERL